MKHFKPAYFEALKTLWKNEDAEPSEDDPAKHDYHEPEEVQHA